MVAKCADSKCNVTSLDLRDGRVFIDDGNQLLDSLVQLRYAWLCNKCAERMTVIFDQQRGEACVVPLTGATAGEGVAPGGVETLAALVARVMNEGLAATVVDQEPGEPPARGWE